MGLIFPLPEATVPGIESFLDNLLKNAETQLMGIVSSIKRAIVGRRLALKSETIQRISDRSASKFDRPLVSTIVALIVALSLIEIFQIITPPADIAAVVHSRPLEFREIRDGDVFFSRELSVSAARATTRKQIRLPFINLPKVEGYDARGIWYEFRVELTEEEATTSTFGVTMPRVWGRSMTFVNGRLMDFGTNTRPTLPLVDRVSVIDIRVDVSGGNFVTPISGTFPLVVGKIDSIRQLGRDADLQNEQNPRALAIYAIALMLFGMLFVAYPRRPEMLAFIAFLVSSFGNIYLAYLTDTNQLNFSSPTFRQIVTLVIDLCANVSLVSFSLLFFRVPIHQARKFVGNCVLVAVLIGPALVAFLQNSMGLVGFRHIGNVVLGAIFLGAQMIGPGIRLPFILTATEIPRARKVACAFVLLTILLLYLMNVTDYFYLLTTVTTLPRNNLVLHVALAIVVAFEAARAEVKQLIFGSMLPAEVKESFNRNVTSIEQQGFVILIDALGYSSDRKRFDDHEILSAYLEQLARRMLEPLRDLAIADFSILNCTGDGLYCAIRGEVSAEKFKKATQFATWVTQNRKDVGSEIRFRAAIGYGSYGVKIIQVGELRKEFTAGNVLNDLSRIIGSEKNDPSIRILISSELKEFAKPARVYEAVDKHGFKHQYFELEDSKKEAA